MLDDTAAPYQDQLTEHRYHDAVMDDDQLERLASNNPAMTVPTSCTLTMTPSSRRPQEAVVDRPPVDDVISEEHVSDPALNITTSTSNSYQPESKYDKGWRRIVRNFSPAWFTPTMGTGVVSLLLIAIPFQTDWLYWLSVVFFVLNLILFTLASVISMLRYTLYPEIWSVMIHDPNNSLFLATAPMGFATLIGSFISLCCPYWGNWATTLAWILWMIDSIASFAVSVSLSFILISQTYLQSLDRITAVQLLPIAATIVASGQGAKAAHALIHYTSPPRPDAALGTLLTSYVMWGMSTPFALVTLVIYYQRLAVHKLPSREIIVSSFLPLGPLGMGGWTIMYLGAQARDILPLVPPFLSHVDSAADMLYLLGIFIALIMWAFGTVWFVYALAAIYSCGSFPFNMGWWGFTFPLGVFALSTMQLGVGFPSLFFRVLGTVFGVLVTLLWAVVFSATVRGAVKGTLFYAPCLKNLPRKGRHGACVEGVGKQGDLEKGA